MNPEDESDVPLYNKQDAGEETTPGTLPLFEVGKSAVTADIKKNAPGKYHFRNGQYLHYRLTFDLDIKNEIPGKNLSKVVKFQNLVEKCRNIWKI